MMIAEVDFVMVVMSDELIRRQELVVQSLYCGCL